MFKIVIILFLAVFLLTSCGDEITNDKEIKSENNKIEKDSVVKTDLVEIKNEISKENKVESNVKTKDEFIGKTINEIKFNNWILDLKKYTSEELVYFDCNQYFPLKGKWNEQWKTENDKKLLDNARKKCSALVNEAKSNSTPEKYLKNFTILDCKNTPYIEICEIQFALENDDCGLIDDKVKNNKCEKFKIKLDEERELNAIKNFRIEDHIK